ncbi:MAG: MarR family winged helix-turn-helix transcriptional regulator [Proteobacteria bacterium]|nr:MarR family winged helix-turn-helix transcriptional regulator [Pseudomonadota bacterium]
MGKSNDPLTAEIAKDCMAVRVRKLNRMITSIYDDCFREYGLTVAQFNLLVSVGSFDAVMPKTIGEILSLEKSSLSRNIEKMRLKGWVSSIPGDDQRSQQLSLTSAGHDLLKKAKPAWEKAQRKSEDLFGGDLPDFLKNINWV